MLKETLLSQSVRQICAYGAFCQRPALLAVPFSLTLLASASALAQSEAPVARDDAAPQAVVVTGSRFGSRIVSESATPIDLVPASELAGGGQLQLQTALKELVPSFSVSSPAATGGTLDFASSPTLRGLGPGELLLLVNGKRRHSTGTLNVNNQIGRGDVAYDFSTIPVSAIGRVEVLRDGASAQYGADAIAGVINIVLDKSLGGSASVMTGITTEGDGQVIETNASLGVPLGDDGVLRTSVRIQDRKESNRALPDTRQQYFGNNGATAASPYFGSGIGLTPSNGALDAREATIDRNTYHLGDTPFLSKSIFLNAEKPLADGVKLYAFGGFSRVNGESYGFARRAAQDETVRSVHPDGYTPLVHVDMENSSLATGARGQDLLGFDWDLSTQFGRSKVDSGRSNSNNASLGDASPTTDYFGGIRFGQWTSNLDLTRELAMAAGAPVKLALGLEFRKEYFKEVAGSLNSYQNGGATIIGGPNNGKPAPIGTQPTIGNTPADASNTQRHSTALYAELERDLTPDWMLSGAARYENFSDFGNSSTFKLATRYAITPQRAEPGAVAHQQHGHHFRQRPARGAAPGAGGQPDCPRAGRHRPETGRIAQRVGGRGVDVRRVHHLGRRVPDRHRRPPGAVVAVPGCADHNAAGQPRLQRHQRRELHEQCHRYRHQGHRRDVQLPAAHGRTRHPDHYRFGQLQQDRHRPHRRRAGCAYRAGHHHAAVRCDAAGAPDRCLAQDQVRAGPELEKRRLEREPE
jgi:iron complex outermembrane receptor protein